VSADQIILEKTFINVQVWFGYIWKVLSSLEIEG
jgi:hypothetical protein